MRLAYVSLWSFHVNSTISPRVTPSDDPLNMTGWGGLGGGDFVGFLCVSFLSRVQEPELLIRKRYSSEIFRIFVTFILSVVPIKSKMMISPTRMLVNQCWPPTRQKLTA